MKNDSLRPRSPSRHGQWAIVLVASAGLCAGVSAGGPAKDGGGAANGGAGQASTMTAERMLVRTGVGQSVALRVANPDAFRSESWPDTTIGPLASRSAPATILYGRAVVEAESLDAVVGALAAARGEFPWLNAKHVIQSENLETFFRIEARTVRQASRLAEILRSQPGVNFAGIEMERPKVAHGGGDPALDAQWHINNTVNPIVDHKILEVHNSGITGEGVIAGILEAFQGNFSSQANNINPDLIPNYLPELSQEVQASQLDVSHAVAVAGLVAAAGENGILGRGVAYNAGLVALRNGSSIEIAEAWTHRLQQIHLVNNSWGPGNITFPGPIGITGVYAVTADDFEVLPVQVRRVVLPTVEKIGLENGIRLGRARKGRVFVFSAGNGNHFQGWTRFNLGNAISLPQYGYLDIVDLAIDGGIDDFVLDDSTPVGWRYSGVIGDRVEYNLPASNPYTFAIAAVGENNQLAGYSTTGCSVFAAAYSLGGSLSQEFGDSGYDFSQAGRGITTTGQLDLSSDNACPLGIRSDGLTCSFSGTSASAPIASGIIALMLEANPNLTIRDIQHIIKQTAVRLNLSEDASYWTTLFGYGDTDPDDQNTENPTFWQENSGDVFHSDEYGFGLIDAEAAVALAADWQTVPRLVILDSGVRTEIDLAIPDAVFEVVGPISDIKTLNRLVPGDSVAFEVACARENLLVEAVELTLTIEGNGPGDLFIILESPRGSVSPIAIPRADSTVTTVDGTDHAYFEYTFTTYKHWGELAGGSWIVRLQDFRSDEDSPEGSLPGDDPIEDPGEEEVTLLGPLGLPGAGDAEHDEKTLVSARIEIHGTPSGLPPTTACPPLSTNCPADLNANGIVEFADLALYLEWYTSGNLLADLTGDGVVNFTDLQAFVALWQGSVGFCENSGLPFNRPNPNSPQTDPIIRPT